MQGDALHEVFRATVLAKLLYCSPAWSVSAEPLNARD